MIFDADTHLSPYRNFDKSIDAVKWAELMDKAGIDKALCWLLPQGVSNVSESNRYLYVNSKQYHKMLPFGWANVREGLDKAMFDACQCIEEYGFAGVKLNGAQNAYNIDGLEAMKVAEQIAKLKGIIAFHIGVDEPDFTNPRRAERVAKAFPEMPVLMVHMGGAGSPDCSDLVIEVAKDNPNMILIGSAIDVSKVENAIRVLGPDRVMFGSDVPFADPGKCVHNYHNMLSNFDENTARDVLWNNAARLFMLK
jgi:Predicted metal-dependent hydrolase of the TIM-barrel fold